MNVGSRSTSDTGASACTPGLVTPGPETISGTRAECSKRLILYHKAALAQHVAVVGSDNDDRCCRYCPASFSAWTTVPSLAVEIAGVGVIGVAGVADLVWSVTVTTSASMPAHQPPGMRVVGRLGGGHVDGGMVIQIPPFGPGDIGVVRVNETDHHGKGRGFTCIAYSNRRRRAKNATSSSYSIWNVVAATPASRTESML